MRELSMDRLILDWYDAHARELPWRIPPAASKSGVRPDPYHIWMSEVMLQQTTVVTVKEYFYRFITRWPDVHALAGADDADVMAEWAGLGYYARARNLLKCARVVSHDFGGTFPETRAELLALPGIGPYTAAAIGAIAFGHSECVVDGNVERVMARIYNVATPLPTAKAELTAHAAALTPTMRAGDYAQSVMDLGATICTPKPPQCGLCPWQAKCKSHAIGSQNELPYKVKKPNKPVRYGHAYVARTETAEWVLERRPDKGLLGGMLGWHGSDWNDTPSTAPPFPAKWHQVTGEVRHTFTHFHLRLTVHITTLETAPNIPAELALIADFKPTDLPTVMRKVLAMANPAFNTD